MTDRRAGRWCGRCILVALLAGSGKAWSGGGDDRVRREVIPVDETHGAPPGFHAERETRWGPIIAGACTTAVGGLSLATGLQQHAELQSRTADVGSDPGSGGEFFIIAGVVALAAGIPILTYGLVSQRDVYVRDTPKSVSLRVAPGPRSLSASMTV